MRKDKLEEILRREKGERKVSTFLGDNPQIIRWSVCPTGGHSAYVLKEFPLGNKFRADFVVPYSYSGCWEVHFIELEPPDDHVINCDGTVSKRLNKAISQIGEWIDFIEKNQILIRQDLARYCMERDLLGWMEKGKRPTNYTSDDLGDSDTFIRYMYHIVIGNRWEITKEKRKRMNQQIRNHSIRVFTFGRFLDIARNLDKADKMGPNESVCLTETEEF